MTLIMTVWKEVEVELDDNKVILLFKKSQDIHVLYQTDNYNVK